MKKLLFISILGESSHYKVENFKELCSSGLEKDWFFEWYRVLVQQYGFELMCIDLCRGDILPHVEDVHAVIVGGSAHLIDEKRQWIYDLLIWLNDYRVLMRPLLGICGGHQLVATRLFNGIFAKRRTGNIAGTIAVDLTEAGRKSPLFLNLPTIPRFHFNNFLHVVPSPEMTDSVLAIQGESRAVAIDHGGYWYSVQFHPEATKQMLVCYSKENDRFDSTVYAEEHNGNQLFENFLSIAEKYYTQKLYSIG